MDGPTGVRPLPEARPAPGEREYLQELLRTPAAAAGEEASAAIEAGPFDPALALPRADAERLCDPEPLEVETGWTVLLDGSVQVAASTPMPDLTPEMVDWWFDWHPRRSERYRVWHPTAHISNGLVRANPAGAKPSWGAVNLVEEDIGYGAIKARIEFMSPSAFGFDGDHLEGALVGTIICARAGDARVSHTDMAHVFLREGDGLRLRSRFWIGERVRPRLPGPLSPAEGPIESLISRRVVRRLAIPDSIGPGLTRHCVEEYSHLNLILPGLFERFGR
jgi:hypothetical protein